MANNQMNGQLRVDNNIGREVQVDTRVDQIPDNGLSKFADTAASAFAGIGDRIGQMADAAAAKEGAAAGRAAGLDPEFRTANNGTIRGDAFDRAGLDVAETRFRQQIDAGFDASFAKHAADPAALEQDLAAQRIAILQHAPTELKPGLELLMNGKRLQFGREQARRQAADAQSAAAGALDTQLSDTLKGMHQRAYALGLDPQSDRVLGDDVATLAKTLARRGPDGQRLVSPEAAAKQLDAVKETVATARLSGAFSRLPTIEAKAQFIKEFEDDFASSKGLAKVYNLESFDRVKSSLEADYRAAKTQQATQTAAVKEDVTAVAKMAEKGFAPAPDQLAALKARVSATGDPKLGETMAIAEDTMGWQSSARRSTPAELEAYTGALRDKLQGAGATPAGVARLELGEKLLDNMRKELKQDPLGWVDRVGIVPVAPIDLSDPDKMQASIRARIATADQVGSLYGQTPQYLRPDERNMLATAMAKGGRQALAVATAIAGTAGDKAVPIMAELGDQAPVMAGLGALVAQSAGGQPPPAAIDAFDALAARQERAEGGKTLPAVVMPKPGDVQSALSDVVGGALSADPRNEAAAVNAATLVYEIRAARAHVQTFDPDMFKQALSEVLGERTIGGVTYGGVARQSTGFWSPTNDIVLPPNVRQDGWHDAIDALSPSVLDRAGLGQPVTESGKAIDFDRFKQGQLVQIGSGQYLVALGDPSKPGAENFAAETKTEPGRPRPLVLDFNKLSPVMSQIRPDLFLGGTR